MESQMQHELDKVRDELESLKERIRSAQSMKDIHDIRREIGPSETETQQQLQRLAALNAIAEKCDFGSWCPSHEAQQYRKRHERLLRECAEEFEGIYC